MILKRIRWPRCWSTVISYRVQSMLWFWSIVHHLCSCWLNNILSLVFTLVLYLVPKYANTYLCVNTPVMLSLSPSVHLCRLCPQKNHSPKKEGKKNSSKCVLCASCAHPLNNFWCWQFQQTAPRSMHLWHHEKCLVVCGVKKKRETEYSVSVWNLLWVARYSFNVQFENKIRSR